MDHQLHQRVIEKVICLFIFKVRRHHIKAAANKRNCQQQLTHPLGEMDNQRHNNYHDILIWYDWVYPMWQSYDQWNGMVYQTHKRY